MERLDLLKNMSNAEKFPRGSVVIHDGDAGHDMYILLKGQVGIYKNYMMPSQLLLATLSPGDFFGEMSLFLGKSRTATVVAIDDLTALRINRENAFLFFKNQPEFTFSLITALCGRLDSANNKNAKLNLNSLVPETDVSGAKEGTASEPAAGADSSSSRMSFDTPPSALCSLFPEGHGDYELPIDNTNDILMSKSYACPICRNEFKEITIKKFKLINARTDPDMRIHYRGIEPLHYDVVTCPKCYYSAMDDVFLKADKGKALIGGIMQKYVSEFLIKTGEERDSFTVFAGYYLALECAPVCFSRKQLISGRLWLKLSRLYDDCEDQKMSLFAAKNSLADYMKAYEQISLSPDQSIQICTVIGELNIKVGDLAAAKNSFYRAKVDKAAGKAIKNYADNRLEDIREMMQKEGVST